MRERFPSVQHETRIEAVSWSAAVWEADHGNDDDSLGGEVTTNPTPGGGRRLT
jgi:hypothetical protein